MAETAQVQINTDNIDDLKADTRTVGESIITLNHELGIIQGELTIMKWLMGGTFIGVAGDLILSILRG